MVSKVVYYWYHVASNCNCSNGMSHIQAGIIFKTKLANVFPIYLIEQCSPLSYYYTIHKKDPGILVYYIVFLTSSYLYQYYIYNVFWSLLTHRIIMKISTSHYWLMPNDEGQSFSIGKPKYDL